MIRWWPIWIFLALLALGAAAALAQSAEPCPADRPHERMVMSGYVNCTLLACIGPLICPDEITKNCYRGPVRDCNTCTPSIQRLCLSDAELAAAKQRK